MPDVKISFRLPLWSMQNVIKGLHFESKWIQIALFNDAVGSSKAASKARTAATEPGQDRQSPCRYLNTRESAVHSTEPLANISDREHYSTSMFHLFKPQNYIKRVDIVSVICDWKLEVRFVILCDVR